MIYDCFTFFNELDLLEIRLNILGDYVDTFVICEGDKTFRGKAKPFYFEENAERFEKWEDKIVYLKCPMPKDNDTWAREEFQRDWITVGLQGMTAGDLIFISDLDEIWNPERLNHIKERSFISPVKLEQNIYYYYLNLMLDMSWRGSVALRGIDFMRPQLHRAMGAEPHIENAGWHFSYLGDEVEIAQKIQAFSHYELDTPEYTDANKIRERMNSNLDLFGRKISLDVVAIDHTYPAYIRDNQDKLSRFISHA